jgi:hypothetical protein
MSVRHRDSGPGNGTPTEPQVGQRPGPGKHTAVQQLQGSKLYASWDDTAGAGGRPKDGAEAKPGENDAAYATLGQGGGEPLPAAVIERMSKRFGRDFSHVRIHTGSAAERATSSLGAKAMTRGTNIYFGAGQFRRGGGVQVDRSSVQGALPLR